MSVCLSVATRQSRICEAYTETTTPISVKIEDNVGTTKVEDRVHYNDVRTNPRWRMAANTEIVMSAYRSEK